MSRPSSLHIPFPSGTPEYKRAWRAYKKAIDPEWYELDKQKHREQVKRYLAGLSSGVRRERSERSQRNITREQRREYERKYRLNHKDKLAEKDRNRKAVKRGSSGNVTKEQWAEIVAYYQGRCAYCFKRDTELTQDHMLPVSRGGLHEVDNLVPACRSCNAMKGTKTPMEFIMNSKAV